MTSAAVQAPAAQIGSMTAHSASEICRPRAIVPPPLATSVARVDYDCGYLSRGGRNTVSGTTARAAGASALAIAVFTGCLRKMVEPSRRGRRARRACPPVPAAVNGPEESVYDR